MRIVKFLLFGIIISMMNSCLYGPKPKVADESTAVDTTLRNFKVKQHDGYFVKSGAVETSPTTDFTLIMSRNQMSFDTLFGKAKTMNNEYAPLNFLKSEVMALVANPTDLKVLDFKIDNWVLNHDTLTINMVYKTGEKQSYTTHPVLIFEFARKGISEMYLYLNDVELKLQK